MGRYAGLALGIWSISAVLRAEAVPEAADGLSLYNLDAVVVTATRAPLSIKETPVLTRVISAREIETSGLRNIQEVLESELAGVEFHQAGYGESMTFQGLDARYLLFLVDGERIAGETYGNIDYGRIPLNNIERIEIVRGASSVLYGSSAMGAVINIITKTPESPVRIVASGRFGTRYEKNDALVDGVSRNTRLDIPNLTGDLYAGFNFGALQSQTTLSYIGTDGYMLFSTAPEVRHYAALKNLMNPTEAPLTDITYEAPIDELGLSVSGQRNQSITQRLDYTLDPRWKVYAKGGYFQKSVFAFPSSQTNAGDAADIYTWETYNSYNWQGGIEFAPNENHQFTLSYNGDLSLREKDSLQFFVPKQKHLVQNPRLLYTGRLGEYNRLTAGVEYVGEQLNYDLSRYGYADRRDLKTASAYIQDEILIGLPLSFSAGIRGDYSNRFGWNFTPRVSGKYAVGDYSLRVNYSEGYRNPTLKELYMNFLIPTGTVTIVGNPELKPEYNRYLSVAAEYINGFTQISLSGYTSWFRDKIDVREVVEGRTTKLVYNNIDKSRYTGLELMARTRLFPGFFVMGNYNYVHQMEAGNTASQQYIYPSPHTATLQLDYRFMGGEREYGVRLSGRYIGEKEYSVAYSAPLRLPDYPGKLLMGAYTASHEAYTLWNLSASAQLTENLLLQAGIDNLLDYRAPVIDFNASMSAGRNGFVKLVFSFE
jgi:outer membrane receptor for ferrienterochelin and colicins